MSALADATARAWLWAEYLVQCGDEDAVAAAVAEAEALAAELSEAEPPLAGRIQGRHASRPIAA